MLYPPINEQLTAQGYQIATADRYEKQRHAINVLILSDLLSENEAGRALERLHKRIVKDARAGDA